MTCALAILLGLVTGLGGLSARRQIHPRTTRLRQTDGDRLLRGSCAVLAFADVMELFTNDAQGAARDAARPSPAGGSIALGTEMYKQVRTILPPRRDPSATSPWPRDFGEHVHGMLDASF